jgi:hypothetical protein
MRNEKILQDFIWQVWNEKDYNSIPGYVNEAYTIHLDTGDPWEGKTLNHQEFETRLHYSFNSFPDIHFKIQNAIADGNYVAITWIMTGTNLGNIGDIPATKKPIKTTGTTICYFKDVN